MFTPLLHVFTLLAVLINLSHYSFLRSLATDTRLKFDCSSTSYDPDSSYEKNLNAVFSLLTQNATLNKNLFYNTSVGGDANGSGTVYGRFLCRGDDTRRDCKECVANATMKIFEECPHRPMEATIWYVDCIVRYSNKSMFGVNDASPVLYINTDGQNMTGDLAPKYMASVGETMHQLAAKAANSSNRYATMETRFTSLLEVYSMAQCTPDLSTDQCLPCLATAYNELPNCCNNSKAALVMTPSCNIRYDLKPFYKLPAASSVPLSTPFPAKADNDPSTTNASTSSSGKKRKASTSVNIALVVLVAILVVLISICVYLTWRRGRKRSDNAEDSVETQSRSMLVDHWPNFDDVTEDLLNAESLRYHWTILRNATNNFSEDNKLGQGGFGIVYKGILANGQEIAVKRLSEGSTQGAEQFKNEVVFVAKLQHRNLVKLLGFSLARYEKLLVYEYVPNKSLDQFLFDHARRSQLNWPMRYNIIKGIARGILYLHEDSRLRIIHRDLKASNILLDANMNPKISDFGMARKFKVDESQANTSRIAGTFGYMAPEYVLHGEFSVKSDVYSFGVLVLEIISGKKSTSFRHSRVAEHISTYVWDKWNEGIPLEIVDPWIGDSYSSDEVKRCIHIGLLCVQNDTEKRPTMASVVFNLNGNSELPVPQTPAFFTIDGPNGRSFSSSAMEEPGFARSSSNSIQLSFGTEESI